MGKLLQLNPGKIERSYGQDRILFRAVLLVMMLAGVDSSVCSMGVLLVSGGLLLKGQEAAVARGAYDQLRQMPQL